MPQLLKKLLSPCFPRIGKEENSNKVSKQSKKTHPLTSARRDRKLEDVYTVGHVLGQGSFGKN